MLKIIKCSCHLLLLSAIYCNMNIDSISHAIRFERMLGFETSNFILNCLTVISKGSVL